MKFKKNGNHYETEDGQYRIKHNFVCGSWDIMKGSKPVTWGDISDQYQRNGMKLIPVSRGTLKEAKALILRRFYNEEPPAPKSTKRYYFRTSSKGKCGCRNYSGWWYTDNYSSKAEVKRRFCGYGQQIEISENEPVTDKKIYCWD